MGGYTSVSGAIRKMLAEEGIRGFYKGLYPNLLKVFPNLPTSFNPRPSTSTPYPDVLQGAGPGVSRSFSSADMDRCRWPPVWRRVGSHSSLSEICFWNCNCMPTRRISMADLLGLALVHFVYIYPHSFIHTK